MTAQPAEIRLIATDLDGTLLRRDKTISPRTAEAIRLAHAAGLERSSARAMASRRDPVLDPWSAAVLVERFGDPVWDAFIAHVRGVRRRAVTALSVRAAELAGE